MRGAEAASGLLHNRQDAAFQAGWDAGHVCRYRLRALTFARLNQRPSQIGTLVSQLDQELDQDDDLSQALLPEVWNVARKKADLQGHAAERRHFLRILRSLCSKLATQAPGNGSV